MSVGAIVLLVAVMAITLFEVISLIITIVRKKKERKVKAQAQAQFSEDKNNNKEGSVQ